MGATCFNLLLRPHYRSVHFVLNFIDDTAPIELCLDKFISLKESLQLGRQLVVLCSDQVHVLVERIYLILHLV